MYYMTTYVAKFEDDTSDLAAMDSGWKGLERDKILPTSDDRERLRRLIIRMNYLRQLSWYDGISHQDQASLASSS